MDEIKNLTSRIFSKDKKKEGNIYDIWDYLMVNYGWIPKNEILTLDINDANELISRCNARNEKLNKRSKK